MMQALRDNMKLIIWITAIVFLVGFGILELGGVFDTGAGRGPSGVIAKINGETIRYEEFARVYSQMLQQVTQGGRELQEGEDSYVREQAWQNIVSARLIEQEARRRGIRVTPEEIKTALRVAPPEFLTQAPGFQTDGQFDYRKYLAELDNPNSQVPWGQIEALIANQLPAQKLQEQVYLTAKVSNGDVRERYLLQNEYIELEFIRFVPDSFEVDTTRIGGADVESYYKGHPEEFTGGHEAKVRALLVRRLPGEVDFAAARERLQGILDQARAEPDSFESLARRYSEIQSAARGGDPLSEPYLEDLRPVFRNGLRDVPVGSISDVLQEERSVHIFRIDGRKVDPATQRERIKYKEIALRVAPGADAVRAQREQVQQIIANAKKNGLQAAATARGLSTYDSDYFTMGFSQNEVLQRFPEVEVWMFQTEKGAISRAVPHENGWYVFEVLDNRPAGLRPLAAVPGEARAALIRSLRTAKAEEVAARALADLAQGEKPDAVAAKYGGHHAPPMRVTRNGFISGAGTDARSVGIFFTMPDNQWSRPLAGPAGVFLGVVRSHTTPSEEEYQAQAVKARESLLNERRQVIFYEWMNDLRRRAKIEDYRDNYFDT